MTQKEQTSRMAVLLFTDIVESVDLERRVGTEAYSRLLKLHHTLFREILQAVGAGTVHQDTGDGFLVEFTTPGDAVNAALLFQGSLRRAKWESEEPRVRVGIHQGQLAEIRLDQASPGKIVGMPVNIAARVMSVARGGQILMTRSVYDDARQFVREHPSPKGSRPAPPALEWKSHGPYFFKGADEPIEIFEVGATGLAPLSAPIDSDKGSRTEPQEPKASPLRRTVIGAALTALSGLTLLTPLGNSWVDASYDNLFRFGGRTITNKLVIVFMDNEAYDELHQTREQVWDRALHARLLNKLADDGCPLVVLDSFLGQPRDPTSDAKLAEALARQKRVVLMARQAAGTHPDLESARPSPPIEPFLSAAKGVWGVAWLDPELDDTVRRHWPFPAPGPYPSLPWVAARQAGASLDNSPPREQWLRYYGARGAWTNLSYHFALNQRTNYFRDTVVFIGNKPRTSLFDKETDEFRTPFTRWTGEASGGVEIQATSFLNLVNGDWLRRSPWWAEAGLVVVTGLLLGAGFCRVGLLAAITLATGTALLATVGAVLLTYFTNFWFPWLVIVGGQLPCALAWGIFTVRPRGVEKGSAGTVVIPPNRTPLPQVQPGPFPHIPEYERFHLLGKGGFGEVWLVRSAIGQWQALKFVPRAGKPEGAYNTEFEGIRKYKPVSEKHPGLLRVELVSAKKAEGYFYYVMELGDSQIPGWESDPRSYKPLTLETKQAQAPKRRLPVGECIQIGIVLAETLDFLHRNGLTHRDIKPSNIIFVKGVPKLADVGLVTEIRPLDEIKTHLGPPDFMPPQGQLPGTAGGDIYSLGLVLYVVSTGRDPDSFPQLSASLIEKTGPEDFIPLNTIILRACKKNPADRYQSAADLRDALRKAQRELSDGIGDGN